MTESYLKGYRGSLISLIKSTTIFSYSSRKALSALLVNDSTLLGVLAEVLEETTNLVDFRRDYLNFASLSAGANSCDGGDWPSPPVLIPTLGAISEVFYSGLFYFY